MRTSHRSAHTMNRLIITVGLLILLGLTGCGDGNQPNAAAGGGHPPVVYRVNGQTPSSVGRLLSDGQSHYLVAEQGEVGYLLYGIKMPLPDGDFQASVRLRADRSAPAEVAVIDVHAFDPSTRMEPFLAPSTNLALTRLSIRGTDFTRPGQFQDFHLHFATHGLASTMLYELRVQSSGQSGLWVEQTAIQQME